MKKLISVLLMVLILFNFIFCNYTYATDTDFSGEERQPTHPSEAKEDDEEEEELMTPSELEQLTEEGKTDYDGNVITMVLNGISSIFGAIAGIIAGFLNIFPGLIELIMSVCVEESFSIEKTVFGEIAMFDVNYFNNSEKYTIGTGDYKKKITTNSTTKILKEGVANFYYIMKLFAIAISLVVLVYVGIRMAISTIAEDKARYKSMIMAWFESIIILFTLQYIIAAIFGVGKVFQNLVYDLKCIIEESGSISFETDISDSIMSFMFIKSGWSYVLYSVVFWFLIFIRTKFFIMYFKRLITVGFLIFISPLITVTYPIDKIGDGKSQSFSVWLNEIMMNVFIQPIHAMIYLIFMFTAGEIAKLSVWVALAFLLVLTKIEKIILRLFDLRKVTSLKPISEQRKG